MRVRFGSQLFEFGRTTFISNLVPSFTPTCNELQHFRNMPHFISVRVTDWERVFDRNRVLERPASILSKFWAPALTHMNNL